MYGIKIDNYKQRTINVFRQIRMRYDVLVAVVVLIAASLMFFWPKSIDLSYESAKTCIFQPTVLPGLLRSSGESNYRLEASKVVYVANFPIAAVDMCVVPVVAPKEGIAKTELSVVGIPLKKQYAIVSSAPPRLSKKLANVSIPLSKPLTVKLESPDALFTYKVTVKGVATVCNRQDVQLDCDLRPLKLRQGSKYQMKLERYFNEKPVDVVAQQEIQTLEAISIVSASMKQGEVVYAKPTGLELNLDKPVADSTLRLYHITGENRKEVAITAKHSDKSIAVSWVDDLPRQSTYELVATTITAKDGSGLDGAYKLGFTTSGGPKVTNISVGANKVPMGATATITFDQPLSEAQDITQAITVKGGANIVGKSGNKVMVSFAGVPRCSDVIITVTDSLKSSFDISGGSAWSYATRTLCQQVGSIGTSAKGRQLTSYTFGSGPRTVVYTGAIHGTEVSSRALMLRWIDELEAAPRSIPNDVTVVVIPVINPDGVASGSRTNANNVDLNRNFATSDWTSDITTTSNDPFPGGGGVSPLSEPESQALASYIGRVRPMLVLSYHSIGALLAANQAGDSAARAGVYASLSGYRNTTGATGTFEYGISGTADDYYAEKLGVPSILIELGSHTDPQFSRNQKAMWAMIK